MKPSILILLLTFSVASAQGPLQPSLSADPKVVGPLPPVTAGGVPQATMKTLHEVEPRTPLVAGSPGVTVAANGAITINAAGSYYLTGNLTVSSGNAIVIGQNRVTVDLNGFNIASSATPAGGYGIVVTTTSDAVVIKNGTILSPGTASPTSIALVGAGFEYGILAFQPYQAHISNISIAGTSSWAIFTETEEAVLVENCSVRDCVRGISSGTISNCTVSRTSGNAIAGTVVTSSFGKSYIGDGINGTVVSNCDGRTLNTNVASSACGIRVPLTGGIVTNSRGTTGAVGLSNSKSISAGTAVACTAIGETAIINRYNMPASP